MRVEIRYNEAWQKVAMAYDYIASSVEEGDPTLCKAVFHAPLFGKAFVAAVQLYNHIQKNENVLWAFTHDSTQLIQKELIRFGSEDLLQLAEQIEVDFEIYAPVLKKMAPKLITLLAEKNEQAEYAVKRIFGSSLPEKALIMLSYSFASGRVFGGFMSDKCLVSLHVPEDVRIERPASTAFHEIIHYLCKEYEQNPQLLVGIDDRRSFLEALILFFVPRGMLAKYLGLGGTLDTKLILNWYRDRKCKPWLEKLAPYMDEYFKVWETRTVWDFLKERGVLS